MSQFAIVTGGSKGIGRAIVELLLKEGVDVLTCARTSTGLEDLVKTCDVGDRLLTVACDLSNAFGRKVLIEKVKELNRDIDLLVNNTGTFNPGTIADEPEGSLEQMIDTNLYSAYHLTRALLPRMIQRKSGHIFNMCSTASITAYPNGGSYSISKFALLGFSKGLREELKEQQIKVTAILPGAVYTPSWEGVDLPPERFIKPEDIADTLWGIYSLSGRANVEEVLVRPQLGDI